MIIMKIRNDYEAKEFEKAIDSCKGNAYLMDMNGTRLDLNPKESRSSIIDKLRSDEGDTLELFCDRRDDEGFFLNFFMKNPQVLRSAS